MKLGREGHIHCLVVQFWSGDLCICPYYSMYTEREMLFPSPFTFVCTKVAAHSLTNFVILSSMFSNCIQDDVTSQRFSLSFGFKNRDLYYSKPKVILDYLLDTYNRSLNSEHVRYSDRCCCTSGVCDKIRMVKY